MSILMDALEENYVDDRTDDYIGSGNIIDDAVDHADDNNDDYSGGYTDDYSGGYNGDNNDYNDDGIDDITDDNNVDYIDDNTDDDTDDVEHDDYADDYAGGYTDDEYDNMEQSFDINRSLSYSGAASTQDICPIIATRAQITGAYWYNNEAVVFGGAIDGAPACEMTYGDMCFYMMQRRMEVARFELSKPDLATCMDKLHKYDYAGREYKYLYMRILSTLPSRSLLRGALVKTQSLLLSLEDLLHFTKTPTAMSIPSLDTFCPDKATFVPSALEDAVTMMVDFINSINVRSVVKTRKVIKHDAKPPRAIQGVFPKLWNVDNMNAKTALEKIKELVKHEMIVAEKLYKLEQYHAKVIDTLTDIQREAALLANALT